MEAQSVDWVSFGDLADSLRRTPKPILIFIHTDWCKYCSLQDHNTFGDEAVRRDLNENYYPLRLNAEDLRDIAFLNRTYRGRTQGHHELAELLGTQNGQLAFPTTVILSREMKLKKRWAGFVNADGLLQEIREGQRNE